MTTPPNIQEALHGVAFPAGRNDLAHCAARNRADKETLALLRDLPDRTYRNLSEVNHVLGKIEDLPSDQTSGSTAHSQEFEDEGLPARRRLP